MVRPARNVGWPLGTGALCLESGRLRRQLVVVKPKPEDKTDPWLAFAL